MTPLDLKKELEKRMLINPIVTEAIDMVGRGVSENHAFCWSSLKLLDENEALKTAIAEMKRCEKLKLSLFEKMEHTMQEYKDVLDVLKNRLLRAEATIAAHNLELPYPK